MFILTHFPPITYTYRRINTIDYPKFINKFNSGPLITNPPSCLLDLLETYFASHRSLLDHHTPLFTKTNKAFRTAPTPRISNEILSLKTARRHLERIYIALHFILDIKLLRSATNH